MIEVDPLARVDRQYLNFVSKMLERYVDFERTPMGGKLVQRCRVCRTHIETAFDLRAITDRQPLEWINNKLLTEYLRHQCEPIERPLVSLTYEDLASLYEQTEREAIRLAERAQQIKSLLDARVQ